MHTPQTLVAQAKEQITEIDAEAVSSRLDAATGASIVIDVREIDEYYQGHLPKALHLPRGVLVFQIGDTVSDLQAPIIVYCKTGGRAALSAQALQTLGYTNVLSMAGGFEAWHAQGFAVVQPNEPNFY